MIHSSIDPQTKADICILGRIDDFFNRFKIDEPVKSPISDGFVKSPRSRLANPEE